jgi:hypothetical protein
MSLLRLVQTDHGQGAIDDPALEKYRVGSDDRVLGLVQTHLTEHHCPNPSS